MATGSQVQRLRILNNKKSVFGFISSCHLWIVFFAVIFCVHQVQCSTLDLSSKNYCHGLFENCTCEDDFVLCQDQKLPNITVLYHYIKDHVRIVSITGSRFTELPENVLGSCHHDSTLVLEQLKRLDFSNNKIQRIHGETFHCMPNLEELNLAQNEWKIDLHDRQIRYFTSLPSLKHLDLTNAFDEVWNGSIHMTKLATVFSETDMSKLETLKLGDNEFYSFSVEAANTLCRLENLKFLNLSHNNLESPSLPTKTDCLEKLRTIDLSHNKMTRLPQEFLDKVSNLKNLRSLRLRGNLFNCDCGLFDTWNWLNSSTIVVDKSHILCADGYHSSYIDKPVLSITPAELMCASIEVPSNQEPNIHVYRVPASNTVVKAVTGGVICAVVGLTLVAFFIVNREKVRLFFKRWSKRMPNIHLRNRSGYKGVQEVAFVENV